MHESDIRKAGLKVTAPRVKILEAFHKQRGQHLSAEDVYKQLLNSGEEIGLATVYRVLTQFETAGLLVKHHFEGGNAIFELSPNEHHDHLVCTECGKVIEFCDNTIEKRQDIVAAENGFSISHHSLYLYGLCQACQELDN